MIKTTIATTDVDLFGNSFTPEALEEIAKQIIGKKVTWEFQHNIPDSNIVNATVDEIGENYCLHAFIDSKTVEGMISGFKKNIFYFVPGYQLQDGELKQAELSITVSPSDPSLLDHDTTID